MKKIYLGKIKNKIKDTQSYNSTKDDLFILGERIFIEKHSWDCNWYWGFGYIGNKRFHTHAIIFTKKLLWSSFSDVFEKTIFKDDHDFWVFKEYLDTAYNLKNAAETYRHAGHCAEVENTQKIIDIKMEKRINKDLESILDFMWSWLEELSNKKRRSK